MTLVHLFRTTSCGLALVVTLACSDGEEGSPGGGSSSGGSVTTDPEGSGGTSTMDPNGDERPQGLEALPAGETCTQGESVMCNGTCVSQQSPVSEHCELLAPLDYPNAVHLAEDGMLYVSHNGGIVKLSSSGGDVTQVSTDEFVDALLVEGDTLYFSRGAAGAGVFRVPTAGGTSEEIIPLVDAQEMAVTSNGLVLVHGILGNQLMEWDGVNATEIGEGFEDTFLDQEFAYFQRGTLTDALVRAPLDDLSDETIIGDYVRGDFVVKEGQIFSIGLQSQDLYAYGAFATDGVKIWEDGTGIWSGDVSDIRTFPDRPNSVFFVFETTQMSHIMRWDMDAESASHVAYFQSACFDDFFVGPDYAYITGCEGVFRVAH